MKIKNFRLISKILFQQLFQQSFVRWLPINVILVSIVMIMFLVFDFEQEVAYFFLGTIPMIIILSLILIGSTQIIRNFPLQPYIQHYVITTSMIWSAIFFYFYWQIAIMISPIYHHQQLVLAIVIAIENRFVQFRPPLIESFLLISIVIIIHIGFHHLWGSFIYVTTMLLLFCVIIWRRCHFAITV